MTAEYILSWGVGKLNCKLINFSPIWRWKNVTKICMHVCVQIMTNAAQHREERLNKEMKSLALDLVCKKIIHINFIRNQFAYMTAL
jgi:hypothetical protein